jgi:hypothetical protein
MGLLLLLWAAFSTAEGLRDWPRGDVVEALAERNPELGGSFVQFADSHAANGRYRLALQWYRRASQLAGYEEVASARIRRLRSVVGRRGRGETPPP